MLWFELIEWTAEIDLCVLFGLGFWFGFGFGFGACCKSFAVLGAD